jgi:uncharacterized protein (TIGR04255 family)
MADRTLANAPLVEVIAELHWQLQGAGSSGNFDVHWFAFCEAMAEGLKNELPFREDVVPAGTSIPLDVLARSPIVRFRRGPKSWPLVQIGQGLLSVNATPPYDGWDAVRGWLKRALDVALRVYPEFANFTLERTQLQYRDAFTGKHGVQSPIAFFQEIGLVPSVAGRVGKRLTGSASTNLASGEFSFDLGIGRGVRGAVKYGTGAVRQEEGKQVDAAIFEFLVIDRETQSMDADVLMKWFESAHAACWEMFVEVVPDATMQIIRGKVR